MGQQHTCMYSTMSWASERKVDLRGPCLLHDLAHIASSTADQGLVVLRGDVKVEADRGDEMVVPCSFEGEEETLAVRSQ